MPPSASRRSARALVLALAAVVAAGGGAWWWLASRAPARLNLVLITIDTLRADHVGAYGATRVETPTLDRLASRPAGAQAGDAGATRGGDRPLDAGPGRRLPAEQPGRADHLERVVRLFEGQLAPIGYADASRPGPVPGDRCALPAEHWCGVGRDDRHPGGDEPAELADRART